jgi:Rieske Fe-S protein
MPAHWKQDFPIPSAEDSYVTRREFTKFLGLTSVAFLVGTLATAGRTFAKRLFGRNAAPAAVATVDEIPVGGYKLVRYPTETDPCILIRLAADRYVAFDQRCTHLSCPVIFDAATTRLACPCHAGFFSADDGRPIGGPPKRPLQQFEASIRNGRVWVTRNKEESA